MTELTGDEGCDDERQDHEPEQPHEELPRVGDVPDGRPVQVERPHGQPGHHPDGDPGEGHHQQQVAAEPAEHLPRRHRLHLSLQLEVAGLWKKKKYIYMWVAAVARGARRDSSNF